MIRDELQRARESLVALVTRGDAPEPLDGVTRRAAYAWLQGGDTEGAEHEMLKTLARSRSGLIPDYVANSLHLDGASPNEILSWYQKDGRRLIQRTLPAGAEGDHLVFQLALAHYHQRSSRRVPDLDEVHVIDARLEKSVNNVANAVRAALLYRTATLVSERPTERPAKDLRGPLLSRLIEAVRSPPEDALGQLIVARAIGEALRIYGVRGAEAGQAGSGNQLLAFIRGDPPFVVALPDPGSRQHMTASSIDASGIPEIESDDSRTIAVINSIASVQNAMKAWDVVKMFATQDMRGFLSSTGPLTIRTDAPELPWGWIRVRLGGQDDLPLAVHRPIGILTLGKVSPRRLEGAPRPRPKLLFVKEPRQGEDRDGSGRPGWVELDQLDVAVTGCWSSRLEKDVKLEDFDIIHYAGHVGASKPVVDAIQKTEFSRVPLVYINACATTNIEVDPIPRLDDLAAAGVGALIANLVRVPPEDAERLAAIFYRAALADKRPIGEALHRARRQLWDDRKAGGGTHQASITAIAPQLYGDPRAILGSPDLPR